MTSLTARRCVVCDADANKRCSSCAEVGVDLFFCSLEHFEEVRYGHAIVCGKSPPFFGHSPETDIGSLKDILTLPLVKTLRLRFLQLMRLPQGGPRSLDGLKLRKRAKRLLGFDPFKPGEVPDGGPTVATELERLTGSTAEDRDWSDRQQLYCSLLFGAAERWLSYRQETGEPPVDPAHEKWWIMLIYRLTSAVQSAPQLGRPCRFAFDCHERCFETTLAWLQRGMDLDDPALSDCFSEPIFSFAVISQLLRPSETAEAAAAPAAAGPPNKAKGGAEAARTRR